MSERGQFQFDYNERLAGEIVAHGLEVLGLAEADLPALRKNDWRKALITHGLTERTSIRQDWIAEHLGMGTRPNVSRLASEMKARTATGRKLKKLKG